MKTRIYLLLCLFMLVTCTAHAQADKAARLRQWEPEIKAFEEADKRATRCKDTVLFVGSSSIRMWPNLVADFPTANVLNRGFGGSHIEDSTAFAERIVIPYRPRLILIYAGDNDIERGKSPATVLEDFKTFVARVRQSLPRTRILFISIKPSPARWHLADKQREANKLVADFTRTDRRLGYVDVFSKMLGPDGTPRAELYGPDRLHMTAAGYELWRTIIAPYVK